MKLFKMLSKYVSRIQLNFFALDTNEKTERHLKSLKAVTSSINHIIADIFGRERQSEKGLIDSYVGRFL